MSKNFSKNNTGKRNAKDFYQTPYSLTREFLKREKFQGNILEPASGKCAIVKVLKEFNYIVKNSDLNTGDDFLNFDENNKFDNIVTNPPYSLFLQFILKSKKIARNKIAMLLPLFYLHGQERLIKLWSDKEFPLAKVYVFSRYPMLSETLREDGKFKTGMQVYAWYVWKKTYKNEPVIKWIDVNKYVLRGKINEQK